MKKGLRVNRGLSLVRHASLLVAVVAVCCVTTFPADPPAADPPRRLYLDEFRPRSGLIVRQSRITQSKYPCVNIHTHPARLSDEELESLARTMDAAQVAVSIALDGESGSQFLELQRRLERHAPGRFLIFLRMDYIGAGDADDMTTWDVNQPDYGARMADKLAEAVRLGAAGLKLLKSLGLEIRDQHGRLIPPDDPRFDPVWQRAGELGVPVLWHCADPLAFFQPLDQHNERYEELSRHPDWSFHGTDFPSHAELIEAQLRVIQRHPETVFICAHMANLPEDLARLGEALDRHPNMYVETSARIAELGRQPYSAREFFLKHADRILFGTDGPGTADKLHPQFRFLETRDEYFPYVDDPTRFPPQGLWNIYGISLPDDVLRKVYYANAERLIPGVARLRAQALAIGTTGNR
jgi:predicted TIM-barrel fold metal-dependent hydrolase